MAKLTFSVMLLMLCTGALSAFGAQDTSDWITYEATQQKSKQAASAAAISQEEAKGPKSRLIFLGGGSSKGDADSFENDDTAWSLGWLQRMAGKSYSLGFDIAGEGTMLDSTWGQNEAVDQGFSINFLATRNLTSTDSFAVDLGLLLGARESAQDCPRSYLGYQCYADAKPKTEYEANFGVIGFVTFKSVSVGFRATGESTQLTLGINF